MIQITSFGNSTTAQASKIQQATDLRIKIRALPEFMTSVLHFRGGRSQSVSFSQNRDCNLLVYQKITSAEPSIVTYAINQVPNGSETASTDAKTGITTIQASYLERCDIFELVNTLEHEFSHTPQGGCYTHSYLGCWPWRARAWSVPYGLGDIVEFLGRKYFG